MQVYGSPDDPFGYASQQKQQRQAAFDAPRVAAQFAATRPAQVTPMPVQQPQSAILPTPPSQQPNWQAQPVPQLPAWYRPQQPVNTPNWGRGYVPPNWSGGGEMPIANPPTGIWNGTPPVRQELPEDIYGFSKIYGAPIPEGQTWNQWNPNRGFNPGGGQQYPGGMVQYGQQQMPQWYPNFYDNVRPSQR